MLSLYHLCRTARQRSIDILISLCAFGSSSRLCVKLLLATQYFTQRRKARTKVARKKLNQGASQTSGRPHLLLLILDSLCCAHDSCEILLNLSIAGQLAQTNDLLYFLRRLKNLTMHKSARTNLGLFSLLLILMLGNARCAFAQQPAPQRSAPTPPTPTEVTPSRDVHARVSETLIDSSIRDDPAVDQMLAPYSPKVRELDNVIGRLKGELRKGGIGAGSLGNFVADAMRARASIKQGKLPDLAVVNGGGMRRNNITEGELRVRDVFELLPFENALVTIDLSGEQLLKVVEALVSSREAQSGARITYIVKADKSSQLENVKLLDPAGHEREIDPQATYSIVTIDYLYNVGGRYSVLREGKNMTPLGITLRDAVMDYIKSETAAQRDIKPNLDGRFVLDTANSVITGETRPE